MRFEILDKYYWIFKLNKTWSNYWKLGNSEDLFMESFVECNPKLTTRLRQEYSAHLVCSKTF